VHILRLFILIVSFNNCDDAWAESWHLAYEQLSSRIEIDDQSIARNGTLISWRERQVMYQPVIDENSLRKIREVQWRKLADCQTRQLKVLSHALFSVENALVGYDSVRPSQAIGTPFSKLAPSERKTVEALCGQITSGDRLPEPAGDRPALPPAGQDFMPIIPR
jgi:hypothetical protein